MRPASPTQPPRSIVLVGLMGAGKTYVGRRLAKRLGLPFSDLDKEIEKAANATIESIFEQYGEQAFREGERRVLARLLEGPVQVLSTGGGAYMDPQSRERIRERGICVWLKVDLDTLVDRVSRRTDRPLLKGKDPRETLAALMAVRYPVYAEADVTVECGRQPVEDVIEQIVTQVVQAIGAQRKEETT
jgi:shikimate kinase